MKTISAFVLPFFLFGTIVDALAQTRRGRGEIAVLSEDGERLGIEVDGRRYEQFSSRLLLGDIPPGKKAVIVYRLRPNSGNGIATAQTVYESQMLVRADYRIVLSINPKSGDVRIDQQELGKPAANAPARATPAPGSSSAPASTPAPPVTSSVPQGDWRKLVESKNTDTERMRILKARVSARALTTQELIPMMKALSFEYSRLDLAKAALPNLTDRQNIAAVSGALQEPASRKELDAAVRALPK